MRGLFTAGYIAELEDALGCKLADCFDLITGTSTGGIMALGVAAGKSGTELTLFYRREGPRIFGKPRKARLVFGPKYARGPLDTVLRETFGEMRMNELNTPVCITAHELIEGTPKVIKTDHAEGLRWGGDRLVWKVAAATSAAPTYFAPVQLDVEDSHIDGGVWGHNPGMVGLIEGVRYFGRPLDEIRLLSVGTSSKIVRVRSHRDAAGLGLVGWGKQALDLLLGSSSQAAHEQAHLLLGDDHYLRANSEAAEKVDLDNVADCLPLQERGQSLARRDRDRIKALLGL